MSNTSSLLLIEDNPGDVRLLREMFAGDGSFDVALTQVGSMRDAEICLAKGAVDIILLDLGLPDTEGLQAVQRAHAAAPRIPLVVLTGLDDESVALQALQEGAQDYLVKGQIETRALLRSLRYAIERKIMEEALFAEKERAQVTLNCIGDAVVCTNASGDITFLNAVAERMTGWSREEAEGRPMSDVFRMLETTVGEGTTATSVVGVPRSDSSTPTTRGFTLVRRDGFEFAVEESVAPIHDRHGKPTGAVVVIRDVSVARASSTRMAHLAQHDFLTGLPNRVLLSDRINQAVVLARRHAKQTALLFLDLDGFKHINDSLGHSIGDGLLRSVAKCLVDCARASDTVSRQGGDEFVVLLSEMQQPEDAAIAAQRILHAVSQTHFVGEHELHVTASIGVSVFPDDGLDAETLIMNADTAMYQAKENGRQNYQFFKPEMNMRAVERQSIEQHLRRALERGEFSLHYQPKINFRTGAITGAEALLRWTHPIRGAVPPAQFIPVAEDCGLIQPIGNWVLRQACTQARAWVDAGLPMTTMAVNVSAKEFRAENFLEGLFAILDETGLDPRALELELTESVLMKHSDSAAAILGAVRRRGVQVAVDDFGTGYSSLSYLRKFPVDALKIDQSFVSQITAAGGDATIVTAVISMARSLKLRVVAEGVETVEQLAFLRSHACDEAQGYFFSRPVVAEQFAKLLTTGIVVPFGEPSPVVVQVPQPARRQPPHRRGVRAQGQRQHLSRSRAHDLVNCAPREVTKTARIEERLRASVDRLKHVVKNGEILLRDSAVKNDALVELGRVKDEVAAMVVHDLKNPLSVILANYRFILDGFVGSTDRREALEDSQGAGQRMLHLLSNLADVTRFGEGGLCVHPAEVDLPLLIQPLVDERRVLARAERISVILVSPETLTATLDPDLLIRTVENILDNARRYTPRGGRIVVELREVGTDVEIRVGNSGPSIPIGARETIFATHGQRGSVVGRQDLRLGVYFCGMATRAQGGRIWIEETTSLPTIFCIRLPRVVVPCTEDDASGPGRKGGGQVM